jgi:hypothetical protein
MKFSLAYMGLFFTSISFAMSERKNDFDLDTTGIVIQGLNPENNFPFQYTRKRINRLRAVRRRQDLEKWENIIAKLKLTADIIANTSRFEKEKNNIIFDATPIKNSLSKEANNHFIQNNKSTKKSPVNKPSDFKQQYR